MVDIDFFTSVYDIYGHATVDQADKALYAAKQLNDWSKTGANDISYLPLRYGGYRFLHIDL